MVSHACLPIGNSGARIAGGADLDEP
jgi:hypothetical protein